MKKPTMIEGGTPIREKVTWITRGRYVNARDMTNVRLLCEYVRVCQQRMKWPSVPFVDDVESMLKKRAPRPKGKERRG